jgi:localization factor PodJL
MTKAFSRGFKSSNLDSRSERRATASRYESVRDDRRAGARDLDDEGDEELDGYDEDIDPRGDGPLDAVSRRLARRSARAPRDEAPSRRARYVEPEQGEARGRAERTIDPDEIAENAAALVTRRVAKSERQTARALANIADMIESGRRRVDPEIIDDAVAAFERRVGQTERKTAKALENIAELIETGAKKRSIERDGLDVVVDRLGRIENKIAEQPEPASVRPIRSALARLESRLDRLSNDGRTASFEQALSGLDERLADIAAKLDADVREREAKQSSLPGPGHEPIERGPDRAGPPETRQDFERVEPSPRAKRPLADAITDIARRQRSLDDEAFASEPSARRMEPPALDPALAVERFDELHASVDALSRRFENIQSGVGDRSDQLLVLMRQIETLHRQINEASRAEHPAISRRFDDLHGAVQGLSGQLEEVREDVAQRSDQQYLVVRQVAGLRQEIEDLSHALGDLAPRASVAAIEAALHDLAQRIDSQRSRGVGDSALAPAERIAGELRAAMKDLDPAPLVHNLHEDLRAIASRLDELQTPGKIDAKALNELGRQTSEIKELLSALASRPLPLEKLETRLFDLTQRVERLSVGAALGAGSKDIGEVVKAIRSIVATETGKGLQGFNQQLERLSSKLDEALAKSGGKRFEELGARIDDMHKSLAQRIDRGVAAHRPADTGALENMVATLARKIDSALDAKTHNPAFDELGRKIEKLEARIHDPVGAQSIARIERLLAAPEGHFSDLKQRIDQIGKTLTSRLQQDGFAHSGVELGNIENMVRGLGERIDAALEPGAGRRDIEQLEQQIELLSHKLDRFADSPATARIEKLLALPQQDNQLHELSDRIDFMHKALAARIEEGVRVRTESSKAQLTELVEGLARKMNAALAPHAEPSAMQALESQIKQLSARLDRTDGNGAALASIEHKLAEVFERIDETHASATEAAETAVRRATLEVLRQVGNASGALDPEFKEELDDLRHAQEESGERTHETLSAVHETLERVVDRLAAFEDELTEIRGATPAMETARENGTTRREAQSIAEDVMRTAPREAIRVQSAEPKEQRVEPRLATPATPHTRRGRDIEDLDLDALTKAEPRGARSETAAQSEFIAAARRAAQQAAVDADATNAAIRSRRNSAREAEQSGGAKDAFGSTIMARKRPILLGLAALVTLGGIYQLAQYATIPGGGVAQITHEGANYAHLSAPSGASTENTAPVAASSDQLEPAPAPQNELSPTAPLAKLAQSADAGKASSLGLSPIGPVGQSGAGPLLAPKAGAKTATGEPLDNTPVGAINGPAASPQDTATVLKTLAAHGDAAAQYELGVRYSDGRGLVRDTKAAAQWFEKAAEQGLAPAQYRLGSYYEKGVGVDRDYARAKSYYQQAAENGNARAMHNLAVLYAEGNDGKPDYAAASEWFRKAAEFGVRDSQYNLAILYARGLGVGQSMTQSYMWFAVAAAQGDQDAGKKRDEVGARLDGKDLAAAKALVDSFKPRPLKSEANEVTPPRGGWESIKIQEVKPATKPGGAPAGKPKVSQL